MQEWPYYLLQCLAMDAEWKQVRNRAGTIFAQIHQQSAMQGLLEPEVKMGWTF